MKTGLHTGCRKVGGGAPRSPSARKLGCNVPCVDLCWFLVLVCVGSVCWFVLVPCVGLCWFRVLVCVGSVCWFVLVPRVGLCWFRVLVWVGSVCWFVLVPCVGLCWSFLLFPSTFFRAHPYCIPALPACISTMIQHFSACISTSIQHFFYAF